MDKNNITEFSIPRLPLKMWIDRWMHEIGPTRKYLNKERKYLEFWKEKLGNKVAVDINAFEIEGIADDVLKVVSRFGKNNKFETRRKYLLYLSSLYTNAMRKWKWATFNPLTCVDLLRRDASKKDPIQNLPPDFNEFKEKFCSLVIKKMKDENLSQRDGASKCSMTLHTFQFATDPEQNPTIKNFMKVCNGFGIKVGIE